MRILHSGLTLAFVLAVAALALGAENHPAPVLPQQFAGWQLKGTVQSSTDPAAADPVNAMALKEYLFSGFESATYVRDDGRKLALRLARFDDATGAYGAFTFYKQPEMLNEKIGDQGSSLNNRVLFYRGNHLVDAVFDKLTAMSAAELRDLAQVLPPPTGNAALLPQLPTYLPKQQYVKNSAKYVSGPSALSRINSPLTPETVDFSKRPEVVVGKYATGAGEASLMLIEYPNSQIAAEKLRQIDAAHQPSAAQPANIGDATQIYTKRTGPIVVIVSGNASPSDAKSLLASVNYEANVTWSENTTFTKKDNLANLLVNIILLCGILIGFALVAGVAFGGLRVLLHRVTPGRSGGSEAEVEFIALHLGDPRGPSSRP